MGKGKPEIGVVAHLDVVPAEDEPWKSKDPFKVTVNKDGDSTVLTGRGVVDDKGPLASLLVVLERLKENPEIFPGKLSLVIDTAEEVGLDNMRKYFRENQKLLPQGTMVMDGYFPLVAGEKGLGWFEIELNCRDDSELNNGGWKLEELQAGEAYNQVPGQAVARLGVPGSRPEKEKILKGLPEQLLDRIQIDFEGDKLVVRAEGKTAHGSTPGEGVNAIGPLAGLLRGLEFARKRDAAFVCFLNRMLDDECNYRWDGSWLGIEAGDPRFPTGTTVNLGELKLEEGNLKLGFDARLVPDQDPEEILEGLPGMVKKIAPPAGRLEVRKITVEDPLLVDLKQPLPAAALEAYREVTGREDAEPVYMGGRTDATAIPGGFAFGLMRYPEASFYNFHGAEEKVRLEELVEAARIYEKTLQKLKIGPCPKNV